MLSIVSKAWNNGCEIAIVLESVHLSNFGNCVHSCRKGQRAGLGPPFGRVDGRESTKHRTKENYELRRNLARGAKV